MTYEDDLLHAVRFWASAYLDHYPQEDQGLRRLFGRLAEGGDIRDRNDMRGHVTASAVVLNSSASNILMIFHKALEKWLQPGGHIERGEYPFEAARRETLEETGVEVRGPIGLNGNSEIPIDIDIHEIPPNPKKNEGRHFHFDFRYVFYVSNQNRQHQGCNEVRSVDWIPLEEIRGLRNLERIADKLEACKSISIRRA